jgi:hypothetical protein
MPQKARGDVMCFQLSKDLYDEDTEKMLMIDEHGRELASRSPWRFLDECKAPAERQAAIYRHQHKIRASHFADQDRAEIAATYARELFEQNRQASWDLSTMARDMVLRADNAFCQGAAIGSGCAIVAAAITLIAYVYSHS